MKIFDGKKAFVAGGSGGIGLEIAAALADNGALVTIHGKSDEKLKKAADYIKTQTGANVQCLNFPIKSAEFLSYKDSALIDCVKSADIVCICFGPFVQKKIDQTEIADWQNMALLNYALPGFLISSVLPQMIKKQWGRILCFGGTGTSFRSEFKTNAAYAGAKTGLGVLVQSVAAEYGKDGITCNGILPGFVETEYLSEKTEAELQEKMPLKKLISPAKIAEFAMMLLKNEELNGVLLKADQGWTPGNSI